MSSKKVIIFRHGETDWNREGRFQGHLDIPINETGKSQAGQLIPQFERERVEAILSSDLSRAYETARIVANGLGIPVFTHAGLREAHLGAAQGLLREEIEERFGKEVVIRWKSNQISDADISYPGGESGGEIIERVFGAMESFLRGTSYQIIGISTHGGVIRRVMHKVLSHQGGSAGEFIPIPNTVIYSLVYDLKTGSWRIEDQ